MTNLRQWHVDGIVQFKEFRVIMMVTVNVHEHIRFRVVNASCVEACRLLSLLGQGWRRLFDFDAEL
jgi:hypothetical protein